MNTYRGDCTRLPCLESLLEVRRIALGNRPQRRQYAGTVVRELAFACHLSGGDQPGRHLATKAHHLDFDQSAERFIAQEVPNLTLRGSVEQSVDALVRGECVTVGFRNPT